MIYHAGITYSSCNCWKTYENPVVMYPNVPPTDKIQGYHWACLSGHRDTVTPLCRSRPPLMLCTKADMIPDMSPCASMIQEIQEADGTRMSQEFKDQWLVNGI